MRRVKPPFIMGIDNLSNKTTGVAKTKVKVIINMNIAMTVLNEQQVWNLHDIIATLKKNDESNN